MSNMGGNKGNIIIRSKRDGKREFFQHDDRESFEGQSTSSGYNNNRSKTTRGSWQSRTNLSERGGHWRGSRRGQRGRGWRGRSSGNRRYLNNDNEDVDMSGEKESRHQQYFKQNRGMRRLSRNVSYRPKSSINNNSGWHKVTVINMSGDFKEEVMSLIKENVDDVFSPILYEEEGKNLVFYLEKQFHIARAILTLSGRIRLSNDRKVLFNCSDTTPPVRKLTEQQMITILKVMSERYSIELKRLDLKNFHNDPTFIREHIFCPLYRDVQILAVLDIIVKNIPDVEEIDFSNNQIINLVDFEALKECPNLKSLNLANNKLKIIDNFSALKNLPILELNLTGNLIKAKYYEPKDYRTLATTSHLNEDIVLSLFGSTIVSDVAKYFPKLVTLDGSEVDRPIGFAVEAECVTCPKSQGSFFCSEDSKAIISQFLEQYYQAYESNNRRVLEAAYTEDALFSLTASFPDGGSSAKFSGVFMRENRNFNVIQTMEKKHRLLYKGRSDVVDTLIRLPIVTHDPHSFIMDIPLAKPQLIHVMLMGVFRQIVDAESPIRSFMRSLVIVPVGQGFCICNEELFITAATVEQVRKAFKGPSLPATAAVPVVSPSVVSSPGQSGASNEAFVGLAPSQIEMITRFANDSKMLPEYCRLCLEQENWDYNKAGNKFLTLQKQNMIPIEYFSKLA